MEENTAEATADTAQATASTDYTEENIRILEGLEAVRKRPGMYIGDTTSRGLHHLAYEIIDNAVDEHGAGHCSNIGVKLSADDHRWLDCHAEASQPTQWPGLVCVTF